MAFLPGNKASKGRPKGTKNKRTVEFQEVMDRKNFNVAEAGLDLMGSKMTISNRDAEIEVTPIGMRIKSKKTKRVILIPYANVKGAELIAEVEDQE